MSIVAFALSLIFSPVGLIIAIYARKRDGANIWNKLGIIFGAIGTAFWVMGIAWWIISFVTLTSWYAPFT
jgi:hypothetical protein